MDSAAPEPADSLRPIAFNALPQIDSFLDDGRTREEWKMEVETRKILESPVAVDATCVRVPVVRGHSEAVWVETEHPLGPDEARELLGAAPGVVVLDDPQRGAYPTALDAAGRDEVFVGRLRRDPR
ncbi:MAG TPA: Asd/ArgC dimerization domain-containing protein, partial [Thermoanaerobaculia bacterium]|nr:Asd/ArgC dimerization domain-containing protein [Thermoanaerobaculia bacterium]